MRILANVINTNPPDSDYLNGQIRNKNLSFPIPGTPVVEEIYGDIIEFHQKLLSLTGITANDLPDNETNGHQTLQALSAYLQNAELALYDNLKFIDFGNLLAYANANQTSICALNDTDIALCEGSKLATFRFDGTNWSIVGSALTLPSTRISVTITKIDTNTIALHDTNVETLIVYSFNGSVWSQVGATISVTCLRSAICAIDTNLIALSIEGGTGDLQTYSWSGSAWSTVGNGLVITGQLAPVITQMDTNKISFFDVGNDDLRMYEFDGTDWSQVGNDLNITGVSAKAGLAKISLNECVYYDYQNNELRSYRFDGTDWSQVGGVKALDLTSFFSICTLNKTIVHYKDEIQAVIRILNY